VTRDCDRCRRPAPKATDLFIGAPIREAFTLCELCREQAVIGLTGTPQ